MRKERKSLLRIARPGPARGFGRRFFDGLSRRVAKGEQDSFAPTGAFLGEFAKRLAKSLHAKVGVSMAALDAIDECSQIDELAARVHEIKIEHLLACHNFGFIRIV